MKGNKFLAAVLAASMAFSVVPATTLSVFADSVSVEASYAGTIGADHVTIEQTVGDDEDMQATIKTAIGTMDPKTVTDNWDFTNKAWKSNTDGDDGASTVGASIFESAVKSLNGNALKDFTLDSDSMSGNSVNDFSFKIYDANGTYVVKINANALPTKLTDALTAYFEETDFEVAKGTTLRNTDVATKLTNVTATENPILGENGITYSGNGDALKSDGSGTVTIDLTDAAVQAITGNTGATAITGGKYDFTANVVVKDETAAEADRKAIAEINTNTYPDFHGTTNNDHGEDNLIAKIKADLKDAGYTESDFAPSPSASTRTKATATSDGEYKINIGQDNVVDVVLKYSSDQKTSDTTKSLNKFLNKGTAAGSSEKVTEHPVTEGDTTVKVDDFASSDVTTFGTASSISKAVQSKDAVKATTAAEAATTVQGLVDAQLKKDGVDTNGVKVTVTPVNLFAGADKDTAGKVTTGYDAAKVGHEGSIYLLVSTSIKNDFYGWPNDAGNAKDSDKNTITYHVVKIETNELKENTVKTLSLADKTVLLTGGYYTDKKSSGNQDSAHEVTYVEITPVIDPKDANSTIKYTVLDSDKSVVTDTVKVGTDDVYKKDSNTAVKVGTNALGLKITKEGTYTIKATVDDAEATMTLTVKKNFDDVPATAYFANAVKWAYANGMTVGVSANKFGVNNAVTRAQYVTWLYNYAVSQDSSVAIADDDVKATFSDVSTSAYYAKAVQWATNTGVTGGTSATTFSPNKTITRAEAIMMLWAAKGRPYAGTGSEDQFVLHFTDVPTNAYYATAVTWAVQSEVTTGTSTTTFSPNSTCTRSQAVTFIAGTFA